MLQHRRHPPAAGGLPPLCFPLALLLFAVLFAYLLESFTSLFLFLFLFPLSASSFSLLSAPLPSAFGTKSAHRGGVECTMMQRNDAILLK
ncbi:MAG: hypothetical protein CME82_10500 [Halomonas sp.]|nr:hypothetical protein [Halomonas sp.]